MFQFQSLIIFILKIIFAKKMKQIIKSGKERNIKSNKKFLNLIKSLENYPFLLFF